MSEEKENVAPLIRSEEYSRSKFFYGDTRDDPPYLPFDEQGLIEWLYPTAQPHQGEQATHHLQRTGPGQMSKWGALDGEDSFVSKTHTQKPRKKKILICNPFLSNREPSLAERALFTKLIEDYEIYLFEGCDKDIRTASPITHDEFWTRRKNIQPATEAQILAWFRQELSLSEAEWTVLDTIGYYQRCGIPRTTLDLTKMGLSADRDFQTLLAAIDPTTIKAIILPPPITEKNPQWIFKNFPNLEILEISEEDGAKWFKKNLRYLKGCHQPIKLVLNTKGEPNPDFFQVPHDCPIEKIHLNICQHSYRTIIKIFELSYENKRELNFEQFKRIMKRELSSDDSGAYREECSTIRPMHKPAALKISSSVQLRKFLESSKCEEVSVLIIQANKLQPEDFALIANFPNIRWITADFGYLWVEKIYELPHLPHLEYLLIFSSQIMGSSRPHISLGQYPKLEYFEADYCQLTLPKIFPSPRLTKIIRCTFSDPSHPLAKKATKKRYAMYEEAKSAYSSRLDREEKHPEMSGNSYGVSNYSPCSRRIPDAPDGKEGVASGGGQLCTFLQRGDEEKVPVSAYRIQPLDQIIYDEKTDKLEFVTTPLSQPPLKPLSAPQPFSTRETQDCSGMDHGILEGKFTVGEYYALPSTGPVNKDTFRCYFEGNVPSDVKLEIYHHPKMQQCFLRVVSSTPEKAPITLKLRYDFTTQPDYATKTKFEPTTVTPASHEKPRAALSKKIYDALKDDPDLAFLWDDELTKAEKFYQLKTFCAEKLDAKKETERLIGEEDTLEQLLTNIKQRCGVCRHRSEDMMVLAKAILDIDLWMWASETHIWCDVVAEDGLTLHKVDLGGGEMRDSYDRDPTKFMVAPPPTVPPQAVVPGDPALVSLPSQASFSVPIPPVLPQPAPPAVSSISAEEYEARIRARLNARPLFTWDLLENKAEKSPLIRLPKEISVHGARKAYFRPDQLPKKFRERYLYINDPADLARYSKSYGVRGGKRVRLEGPLENILKTGGLLLINWSTFTPEELAANEYLLKNPQVKVVGFIDENIPCPLSFLSHCAPCEVPPIAAKSERKVSPVSKSAEHIDLFDASLWEEALIEDLKFTKKGIEVIEKPLMKAIREGKSLVIHRPPNHPRFQKFIDQVELEKRFWFNGRYIAIPDGISITTNREPLEKKVPKIIFESSAPEDSKTKDKDSKRKKIWMHLNNWYTLYEETIYEKGIPITKPGKLAAAAEDKSIVFYVTETIPELELEKLAVFIQNENKLKGKKFTFQWALGAEPSKPIPKPESLPATDLRKRCQEDARSHYYRTNDPEYVIEQLMQATTLPHSLPRIIDVTPKMGVSDLLVSLTPQEKKANDANQSLSYAFEEQVLLREGGTIILNVKEKINPSLMQELLPLFGDPPTLRLNGQQIPASVRVIIVENSRVLHSAPILARPVSCHVTAEDYQRALTPKKDVPEDKKEDKENKEKKDEERLIVSKLLQFVDAAQYPHRGSAMPPDLGLTWDRLMKMKRVLLKAKKDKESKEEKESKNPYPHKHNLIKSLILNNYLKNNDNEYYECLNVVCKFLFDDNPEHPIRLEKFRRLQEECVGRKSHDFAWRLLNCCNGPMLRQVLGENWLSGVIKEMKKQGKFVADYWKTQESKNWSSIFSKLQKIADETQTQQAGAAPLPLAASSPSSSSENDAFQTKKMKKILGRLDYLIDTDPDTQMIVMKGVPGVGKTHRLEFLETKPERYRYFFGLEKIGEWLADKTNKPKLLGLDEINTNEPGMLGLLEGIHRTPPQIFYGGTWHDLTPQHKIIVAVNPDYFSGRHPHDLLHKGNTEWLEMPEDEYIEGWLCEKYGGLEIDAPFAKKVVQVANLFRQYKPLEGYSFRDLQNLMQRYKILKAEAKSEDEDVSQALYAACQYEFAMRFIDPIKQQKFLNDIANNILEVPPKPISEGKGVRVGDQWFPSEMAHAHESIRQAFLIRQRVIDEHKESGKPDPYKRGVILQGPPEIDKLGLFEKMLEVNGFQSANSPDAKKCYYVTSTNAPDFREIAKKAFEEGTVLLVKDMHFLQSSDDGFLGKLLMGKYEGIPNPKPGFLLLGFKITGDRIATKGLSSALYNRMQVLNIPSFSENSLQQLANQKLNEAQGQRFVQSLFHPRERYTKSINGMTFFDCLEERALHQPRAQPGIEPVQDQAVMDKSDNKKPDDPLDKKSEASPPITPPAVPAVDRPAVPSQAEISHGLLNEIAQWIFTHKYSILLTLFTVTAIVIGAGMFSFAQEALEETIVWGVSLGLAILGALGIAASFPLYKLCADSACCSSVDQESNAGGYKPTFSASVAIPASVPGQCNDYTHTQTLASNHPC